MSHQMRASHPPHQSTSLCSWPPSPALLTLHLIIRTVLIFNNIIGLSLLFPAGVWGGKASPFVGGTFLAISLFLLPFFMIWNRIHLKRAKKARSQYTQVENPEFAFHKAKVSGLKFVTFMDGLGALALSSTYIPLMIDASDSDVWGWYDTPQYYIMFSYGSVAVLVAVILHAILFTTEFLQLLHATRLCEPKNLICPHCNHTMTRLSSSETIMTPAESETATQVDMLSESLVDADAPRISMSPGQETGTTYKTPRQSEHQSRAAPAAVSVPSDEANETGEGERDTLISKNG